MEAANPVAQGCPGDQVKNAVVRSGRCRVVVLCQVKAGHHQHGQEKRCETPQHVPEPARRLRHLIVEGVQSQAFIQRLTEPAGSIARLRRDTTSVGRHAVRTPPPGAVTVDTLVVSP